MCDIPDQDTAEWSEWGEWQPILVSHYNATIPEIRFRNCEITIVGDKDDANPICEGEASETRTIANSDYQPADSATWLAWSAWSPTVAASNVATLTQTRTRSCDLTVNSTADQPPPICTGEAYETQTMANVDYDASNTDAVDVAQWSDWSAWSPESGAADLLAISQTRSRSCQVAVNAIADEPPPVCSGVASESRIGINSAASPFKLADNGITILCSDAVVGDSVGYKGIAYTKRSKEQITVFNALATCTSGITNMSGLFRDATTF